jgi:serine/threonine protein kinase
MYILSEFDNFEKIHTKVNFSKIYIATHIKTKEKVIMKLFVESIKDNIYEHISKELLINKYLSTNTNISMKIKGICIDDIKKLIFLVIEYGDYSLFDYMKNTNYITSDVEKLFFEGAKLLFIMHSYGVIHNDIKLENLIIHNQQLRIIDFGLSDFLFYSPSKNVINNYACTEYTKAPDTRKTYETDIYSLALTIIHLLTKSYYHPHIKYLDNDFTIIKIDKSNNKTYYDSDYFIEKIGDIGYDLLSKMLNPNNKDRINSIDLICHPFFAKFQKFDNDNFKSEIINKIYISKIPVSLCNIITKIPDILISLNIHYSPNDYINNYYELKYKKLHLYHFNKINIENNFDNKLEKNIIDNLLNKSFFAYDAIINTIIIVRQYKMFKNINKDDIDIYMNIMCIIFNSICSYGNSEISYKDFNDLLINIDSNKFYLIYINCLEIILNNKNIYFTYSIISYYTDKIIYETNMIKEKYQKEFKLLCLNDFYNLIIKVNINNKIQFNKLIIFSINKIVSKILNKPIQEYNNNPCFECMKLDDNFLFEISL